MAGKRNKKLKNKEQARQEDIPLEEDERQTTSRVVIRVLLTVLFFTYLFSLAMKFPLNDPDVWWHLVTGDLTIRTMEIPSDDYFSYTTKKPLSIDQIRGLRAQWLGQVVFGLADRFGGIVGVFMFRNLLIILPMLLLFFWLVRNGIGHLTAMGIVVLPAMLLILEVFYAFERPQAFSFLLVLVVIVLLERLRSRDIGRFDFSMALLPITTAVWSNLHAGFLVGNIIILIYFGAELLTLLWRKHRRSSAGTARPAFFAVCAISIFTSFINPNTYHIFLDYFIGLSSRFIADFSQSISGETRSGWVEKVVLEFKPLHYFYFKLHYGWIMYYWVFTGVLVLSLFVKYWIKRSVDLAELLTVAMISFFANFYARGLMFSLTVLPFYMAKTIVELRFPPVNYRKLGTTIVAVLLIITIGFLTTTFGASLPLVLKPSVTNDLITPWYPLHLSAFLEKERPDGPMYNFYTWGGFLIWRLFPLYKVFIDGRALDGEMSWTADSILKTFPEWKQQLDDYNINFIVIPVVFRESGNIVPLAPALIGEDDWKLIYLNLNAAVFIRNVPKNSDLIARYSIDKRYVYNEIIKVENTLLRAMPNNPNLLLAKADALLAIGAYEQAKEIYLRFPDENAEQLEYIRRQGY